jgi:hypothetical protein
MQQMGQQQFDLKTRRSDAFLGQKISAALDDLKKFHITSRLYFR